MIVGTYTLNLYCDEKSSKHKYNEFPHEYVHEFGSTCRRLARKDGWLLDKQHTLCPKCSGKLPPPVFGGRD